MAVVSMTGFARTQAQDDRHAWTWEIRSVNHRGLDFRCRLPQGLEGLEPAIRRAASARLARGSVSVGLALRSAAGAQGVRVDEAVLENLLAVAERLRAERNLPGPTVDGLLALPGVIAPAIEDESEIEARDAAILASFDQALDGLVDARRAEGERLEPDLSGLIDEIGALAGQAGAVGAARPEAIKARLESQIADLLRGQTAIPEERLAQEAAMMAVKADVREEIDRLRAHVASARDLMAGTAPAGRRLDFLCQELNREANTLCSKSGDVDLTRIGLALKTAIDRLREQVQNIE